MRSKRLPGGGEEFREEKFNNSWRSRRIPGVGSRRFLARYGRRRIPWLSERSKEVIE